MQAEPFLQTSDKRGVRTIYASPEGQFVIYQSRVGSRIGDLAVSVQPNSGGKTPYMGLRPPSFGGGGANEKAYKALCSMTHSMTQAQPGPRLRKRPPVIIMSDDFGAGGEFHYLELSSSAKGFEVQVHETGSSRVKTSPIHFSDPSVVQTFTTLYQAMAFDQKRLKKELQQHLKEKQGEIANILSPKKLDHIEREVSYHSDNPNIREHEQALLRPIKETGIFLLKLGIPIPKDICARWMEKFGQDSEVKKLSQGLTLS